MSPYALNLAHCNTAHALIIDMVGENKNVLEIGCASGYLSKIFRENGCLVTGLEIDPAAAEAAKQFCDRVIIGSIEEEKTVKEITGMFDVIVFADVLEHLSYPEKVLQNIKSLLKPDGFLVVSLPNIANWKIRLNLLMGGFRYTDEGILDKSHLRFFTVETAGLMLEHSGYSIVEFVPGATRMPRFMVQLRPGLFAVHLIYKARKS